MYENKSNILSCRSDGNEVSQSASVASFVKNCFTHPPDVLKAPTTIKSNNSVWLLAKGKCSNKLSFLIKEGGMSCVEK